MDPSVAVSASTATGDVHFLNIEYFFYLFYMLTHGGVGADGGFSWAGLLASLTVGWIIITIIAYALTAIAIAVLVYSTIRAEQVLEADAPTYATFTSADTAEKERDHHRWKHVRELIESPSQSDWRQAILEADIMLDDLLTQLGYIGGSVGDKLKQANPLHFRTIQEAWEAHKVRNEIAHRGSSFTLTDHIAYRTILHYENVFKEHGEI